MQIFKRVEVALVHRLLFFQIDLADEITVIAADYIWIVFGHLEITLGECIIVEPFFAPCTKVVHLSQ